MKKIITIILSIMMAAGFCACSVSVDTPEGIVEDMLKAMKSLDNEELAMYMGNNDINTLINNNLDEKTAEEIGKDIMQNLSWEIVSVQTNEEQTSSVVTVAISNADFSGTLKAYKAEAVEYMLYNLYNDEVTKEVMTSECQQIFAQQIKNASDKKDNIMTTEVQIQLSKNEDYGWDMEVTKELTKAIIGGLQWPAA